MIFSQSCEIKSWICHDIAKDNYSPHQNALAAVLEGWFFFTTLSKEYEDLHNIFGWEMEIFNNVNKKSLEYAFCDVKIKEKLIQQLKKENQWKTWL